MDFATTELDFALHVAHADARILEIARGVPAGEQFVSEHEACRTTTMSPAAESGGASGNRSLFELASIFLDHAAFDAPPFVRAQSAAWTSTCLAAGVRLGDISRRMEKAGRALLMRATEFTGERSADIADDGTSSASYRANKFWSVNFLSVSICKFAFHVAAESRELIVSLRRRHAELISKFDTFCNGPGQKVSHCECTIFFRAKPHYSYPLLFGIHVAELCFKPAINSSECTCQLADCIDFLIVGAIRHDAVA